MKVTGSTIQQLDKLRADGSPKPKSECRKWRIWATTEGGRKSERFTGTYSQAQERRKALVSKLEGLVPNSDTFAAYAESWRLWRAESGRLSPGSVAKERSHVAVLLRSPIAEKRMDSITPDDCREALLWIKRNPARKDGELALSTLANIRLTMALMTEQAVDDGKLASDPMRAVKAPKFKKPEREALSPDEIALLCNRLDELPLDGRVMAVYFMLLLGLRRGEALALSDADVSGGFARVHASVCASTGEVGDTKTPAAKRTLPVPSPLAEKVDQWREMRDALGWHDSETLCCNTRVGVLHPTAMSYWWNTVRDRIGCEGMVMHELRHSNLSMVARHMSAFDLQRYAGWSSIEPARIYVHDDLDSVVRGVSDAWASIERTKNAPAAVLGR